MMKNDQMISEIHSMTSMAPSYVKLTPNRFLAHTHNKHSLVTPFNPRSPLGAYDHDRRSSSFALPCPPASEGSPIHTRPQICARPRVCARETF